ncbi:MAG: hypothetical protein MK008_07090 [Bdellovibrionales bacterium]|nr:hypothetical protein [Bdellovibrionales bacterium]
MYQFKVTEARKKLKAGQVESSLSILKKYVEESSDDKLVYLMDYGTALQIAGKYKESNEAFLLAHDIAEIQDYHSISKITASLLFSESMVQYKGDHFEKVFINAMLALNFLMLGNHEAALVETRRLNEKLYKLKVEGGKSYEENEFAYYLAGMIWESDRKYDDAYIDYKKAYQINPNMPFIKQDLLRTSYFARRMQAHRKHLKEFNIKFDPRDYKNKSELVVIYQQGWGPVKKPSPQAPRFPALFPVNSQTTAAKIVVDEKKYETQQIFDVTTEAINTLKEQYAALIAKRVAAEATKVAVSKTLQKENEGLGQLAYVVMKMADTADLRQWSTLPNSFQLQRIWLKPGEYDVRVKGLALNSQPSGETHQFKNVQLKRNKKTFLTWRSLK